MKVLERRPGVVFVDLAAGESWWPGPQAARLDRAAARNGFVAFGSHVDDAGTGREGAGGRRSAPEPVLERAAEIIERYLHTAGRAPRKVVEQPGRM